MASYPVQARNNGHVCPECNRSLYVYASRKPAPGIIRRYRVCRNDACPYFVQHRLLVRFHRTTSER